MPRERPSKRTAYKSPLARCVWEGVEFSIKAWAAWGRAQARDHKEGEVEAGTTRNRRK